MFITSANAVHGYICKVCTHYKNYTVIMGGRYSTYCYFSTCGPKTSPH